MDLDLLGEQIPKKFDMYDRIMGLLMAFTIAWSTIGLPYALSMHIERVSEKLVQAKMAEHSSRPHVVAQELIQTIQIQQGVMGNDISHMTEALAANSAKLDRLLERD